MCFKRTWSTKFSCNAFSGVVIQTGLSWFKELSWCISWFQKFLNIFQWLNRITLYKINLKYILDNVTALFSDGFFLFKNIYSTPGSFFNPSSFRILKIEILTILHYVFLLVGESSGFNGFLLFYPTLSSWKWFLTLSFPCSQS